MAAQSILGHHSGSKARCAKEHAEQEGCEKVKKVTQEKSNEGELEKAS